MSKVDQVEYLKKYLPEEKKKRKRKDAEYTPRVKIIDDDVDIVKSRLYYQDELILTGEDAPQIVGVIDDRPPELKTIEDFRNSEKWKRVSKSASICEVDTQSYKTSSESFSKKHSAASRREKVDVFQSKLQKKINSSYYEKDLEFNLQKGCSLLSNDVLSPKRKNRRKSDDFSPERKGGRHSTELKKTLDSFSKSIRNSDEKRSRSDPKRQTKFSRENSSELFRTERKLNTNKNNIEQSPAETNDNQHQRKTSSTSRKSRSKSSDYSPPRKRDSQKNSIDLAPGSCQKRIKQSSCYSNNSDQDGNDYSLPRKTSTNSMGKNVGDSAQKTKGDMKENSKIEWTLDGKKAGLQDAKTLKSETEIFRKKEDETFRKMSSDISGKNAELVVRAKRRKAATESKREKEQEKTKREQKKQEAYNRWGVGLKQIQNYQNKVADEMLEISKPLARYSNDADLDDMLKDKEREGDPMLAYIREKNNEMKKYSNIPTVPIYKGPFPENRFNIRPGYRWDGVDRSNGYEKKWFDNQNQKKAIQEEAYKYSIEDM